MICAAALFSVLTLRAEETIDERRERALGSFDAIARADRAVAARTRSDLEAVLAARPDDALARVHFGWLVVLMARELPLTEARTEAERGFRDMDAAVKTAPENPAVRLVRARCAAHMPLALGRGAQAEVDFKWLVAGARAASTAGAGWTPIVRREVFFQAGAWALRLRRAGEAVELLEAAARIDAAMPADRDIQSMLALARREFSSQPHAEDPSPDQAPAAAP